MSIEKAVVFVVVTYSAQIISAFLTEWLNIYFPPVPLLTTVFSLYLNIIEIFFHLLTLCVIGLWVYDLRESSLMHANLKFVCYGICFHLSTASFFQIIFAIDKYANFIPFPIYSIIIAVHGCSRMHFTLDPCAAALERGLATLKVANYEKATSRKNWTIFMFFKEFIGIVTFYILSNAGIGAILFAIFWVLLLIFTVTTGIILYRVNLRSYKTRIGTLHLTTRYQTVENIRCLKPVLIYSFLAVTQQIIAFMLLFAMFVHFYRGEFVLGIMIESVMNLVVAVFSFLYPMSFLAYSSRIRKMINKQFTRKSRAISPKSTQVLSVMGKVLTSKNEQNIYFTQFNTAWK